MTKLYWTPLSPPARSVYFFSKAIGIDIETVHVDLAKGEQKGPEFLKVNPHGQVPALQESDGFVVFESSAIIRYLSKVHPNHVFPLDDARKQAVIDENAELVKSKLSTNAGNVVFNKIFARVIGKEPDQSAIKTGEEGLQTGFTHLEGWFFKDSPNFAVGSSLTLVDVLLGTYLAQLTSLVHYNLDPYPKIKAYFAHLSTQPAFVASHAEFHTALQAFVPKA